MWASEDGEGREVLLGVSALGGGVDKDDTLRCPHDVAAPQVAVGSGGTHVPLHGDRVGDEARLAVVEPARFKPLAKPLDEDAFGGREGAVVKIGSDAFARVEGAPGVSSGRGRGAFLRCLTVRGSLGISVITGHTDARMMSVAIVVIMSMPRQGQVSLPHPAVALEPGRWRAQVGCAGGVRVGEGPPELFGGLHCWRDGGQPGFFEPRRAVIEDGHDGCPGVRGLGEPRKARNLVGDPPAAAIRFPDGVHRCGLLSAKKLQRSPPSTPLRDGSTISRVMWGIGNYSTVCHRDGSTTQQCIASDSSSLSSGRWPDREDRSYVLCQKDRRGPPRPPVRKSTGVHTNPLRSTLAR